MTDPRLARAQAEISGHMDAILDLFLPGAKVTVVVRSPQGERDVGARDLVMTNDDLGEAEAAIARRRAST